MNGLEAEFERFASVCLTDASDDEVASVKRIFMAGALAQASRMLDFIYSDLPIKRKQALLRRVARECERFQQQAIREEALADE
jgi:hypothetical protein